MNVCGLTRVLVPAFLVGFMVTSLTTNEALGWLVAAVVGATLLVIGRVRGTTTSCPLPNQAEPLDHDHNDHVTTRR